MSHEQSVHEKIFQTYVAFFSLSFSLNKIPCKNHVASSCVRSLYWKERPEITSNSCAKKNHDSYALDWYIIIIFVSAERRFSLKIDFLWPSQDHLSIILSLDCTKIQFQIQDHKIQSIRNIQNPKFNSIYVTSRSSPAQTALVRKWSGLDSHESLYFRILGTKFQVVLFFSSTIFTILSAIKNIFFL